jgi:Gram-negative porin
MRGFRLSRVYWAAAVAIGVSAIPTRALADIALLEKNGWTLHTSGLVAAHYQLIKGDADPQFSNGRPSSGGQILDERTASDVRDNSLMLSNIRSGFIGTQIGFGLNRVISPTVHVDSLLSINMQGINSNRGQALQKDVDYREAWAQVVTPYGSVRFGRMFGIFGEGSAEVMMMAWKYGVGHPCVINHATIACGSSGAGPIYAGFDGAIRYISPRLGGFELALSVVDPSVSPSAKMSPYPRIDSEINFDQSFDTVKVRLIGQSMVEQIGNSKGPSAMTPGGTVTKDTIWGVMGTGIVSVGGFGLGGGGWTGAGVGERIPLEASDPANPISNDSSLELRHFRGFYGNAQFEIADNSITAGGGILYVQPTALDTPATAPSDVLKSQFEYHVVYSHKFDAIVLNAEYMHWESKWHFDEVQKLNFFGAGINYLW